MLRGMMTVNTVPLGSGIIDEDALGTEWMKHAVSEDMSYTSSKEAVNFGRSQKVVLTEHPL